MFLFPFTYILSDIFTEVYGYAASRRIVWYGALANAIMLMMFLFANSLPIPGFFREGAAAYSSVLGVIPRVVLFSILAYLAGSFANDVFMSKVKKSMIKWDPKHKHLWVRTIGSTIIGQIVDSGIFIFGVFFGTMPIHAVFDLFLIQYMVKVLIEALLTPVTYAVVSRLKRVEGIDAVATERSRHTPFSLAIENSEQNLFNGIQR